MLSRKNKEQWIALAPDVRKLREFWVESSNSDLPMIMQGEEGVGKSFWILESIKQRKLEETDVFKIDYSLRKEFYEIAIKKIENKNIRCIWWNHLSEASEIELRKWISWWKEQRYKKNTDVFLYWEIDDSENIRLLENPVASDLYDLLKQFRFNLNSLSSRKPDMPLFINFFLHEANRELNKSILSFDEQFMQFFLKRKFKTNLHGLRDFIYSAVAFTSKKKILFKTFPVHLHENYEDDLEVRVGVSLEAYEKAIIISNLKYVDGNRVKAAKLLKISERNLYRKIKEYQLDTDS